jgi:hypothetical protein
MRADFEVDAFPRGEPVSTSPENAPNKHDCAVPRTQQEPSAGFAAQAHGRQKWAPVLRPTLPSPAEASFAKAGCALTS